MGTQFGLNYADESGGRLAWKQIPVPGLEMVRALAANPDGSLWIGGEPGGLRQLNPRTKQIRTLGEANGLPVGGVRSVMVDRSGLVWVSANTGLFRSLAPVNYGGRAEFEQQFPTGTQFGERFLKTIEDSQGQIWTAGDLGLARWADGVWRRFTKRDGLRSDGVAQLAEDADGSIWVELSRCVWGFTIAFFPENWEATHYGSACGMRSGKTLFLGFDADAQLWVGTDHGLDVFDHANWRHYGRSDGLIWDDCNSNAYFADSRRSVDRD